MQHRPDPDEIARRGRAVYEERLKQLLEQTHFGEYLVMDVDSGDYEIDPDHRTASDRAAGKHPGASLYGMRIGYPALCRIGAHLRRNPTE